MGIEGLARNVGTHAAAVVIADRPLTDYVPLQHVQDKKEVITQWAMGDVERAGLLKMDFLGLRNLTILSKVVELIEQTTGQKIDPYQFPLDDQETFALLCRGETKGVFQLESGGIRDLLQRMKPDHFRDIIATNALYRPGPLEGGMVDDYIQVKHGRKQAEYKHPVMKEVLEETHGVMVYQEQVMRILNRLGGIELANAYSCIKAISKKKLETIAKFREEFVAGAHEQGMSKKEAAELFGLIEKFAGYGFNKSHSHRLRPDRLHDGLPEGPLPGRVHGGPALQRHPGPQLQTQGFAGRAPGRLPADGRHRAAAGREPLGGRVHRGRRARSASDCRPSRAAAARRPGPSPRSAPPSGPYRSLFDFCERLDPGTVNRTAIESLIKAGAFDSLGARRAQLFAAIDRALQAGASAASDRRSGQLGLFGGDDDQPEDRLDQSARRARLGRRDRLAKEKEVLGFYLSSHPLAEHQKTLAAYCSHTTAEAAELKHRAEVMLGGMISAIKLCAHEEPQAGQPQPLRHVRPGRHRRHHALHRLARAVRPLRSADQGRRHRGGPRRGRQAARQRGGQPDRQRDHPAGRPSRALHPRREDPHLRRTDTGRQKLEQLHEILRGYPGNCELELTLCLADGSRVACKCDGMRWPSAAKCGPAWSNFSGQATSAC